MAIVTLAVRELEVGGSSGFLVPAVDGRRIKAATYSFSKWAWIGAASDLRILRASLGRHREEASLQATDDELVARVVADLAQATGQPVVPVETHVQRWGGALPQYAVGHLDRVARIRGAWRRARARAVRGGVRRRRDPGRDRLGPPGGGFAGQSHGVTDGLPGDRSGGTARLMTPAGAVTDGRPDAPADRHPAHPRHGDPTAVG